MSTPATSSRCSASDLLGGHRGRAAESHAASLGGGQALGTLHDQLADELSKGGEDVEDEAAAGGGGVEGFLQGPEADAAATQIGDDRDEVGQGAGEPVERGDDEGVAGP